MIGGYMYLDTGLSTDIIKNSATISSGVHSTFEYKDAYNIVKSAVSTKKPVILQVENDSMYGLFYGNTSSAINPESYSVLFTFRNAVTLSVSANEPDKYTLSM